MPALHIFNPGHETAILQGDPNYTPSKTVRKMMEDLALLPAWYAAPGDYILVDKINSPLFFSRIPKEIRPQVTMISPELLTERARMLPPLYAQPWGLTPQILQCFHQLSEIPGLQLDVPVWKEVYKQLTHRKTAAACFDRLRELLPEMVFPDTPRFFTDPFILQGYLIAHPGEYVLKTPFSSTGRGLLWVDSREMKKKEGEWIEGAIKKQGSVSLEKRLNKFSDLGLEFCSDGKGKVLFVGIAPFGTNGKGAYEGTSVYEQSYLMEILSDIINTHDLNKIIETLEEVLSEIYGHEYNGCIGVDTLIYRDEQKKFCFHPCVEVNMRNTMGTVALHLQHLIHPEALSHFKITYHPNPGVCNEHHREMKKAYPFRIEDGKIKVGYFSLCPVTKDTRYKAFLIVM